MTYLQSMQYALNEIENILPDTGSRYRHELQGTLAFKVIDTIKQSQPFAPGRTLTADELDTIISDSYRLLPRFNV